MRVITKDKTKSGVKIQIEDWSKTFKYHSFGDVIAMFPTAKTSLKQSNFIYPKAGKKFRLEFWFPSEELCRRAYLELLYESKTPFDFSMYCIQVRYLKVLE